MIKLYLGSTQQKTTGEWSCLIAFSWAPPSSQELEGIEIQNGNIYIHTDKS